MASRSRKREIWGLTPGGSARFSHHASADASARQWQCHDADQQAQPTDANCPWAKTRCHKLLGHRSWHRCWHFRRLARACIHPSGKATIMSLTDDRLIAQWHQIPLPGHEPLPRHRILSSQRFQYLAAGSLPCLGPLDAGFQGGDRVFKGDHIPPGRNQHGCRDKGQSGQHEAPAWIKQPAAAMRCLMLAVHSLLSADPHGNGQLAWMA